MYGEEQRAGFPTIRTLALNGHNSRVCDALVATLAADSATHGRLIAALKAYVRHVDVTLALRVCEEHGATDAVTFCRCAMGDGDGAAQYIIEHDGDLGQLQKLLSVSRSRQLCAACLRFVAGAHAEELPLFLPAAERLLSPEEVVRAAEAAECDGADTALFRYYYMPRVCDAQPPQFDNRYANEKFIDYLTARGDRDTLLRLVARVDNYDRERTAARLEAAGMRDVAAIVYNQAGQSQRCVQLLLEDGMIAAAVREVGKSRDRAAAYTLLEHCLQSGEAAPGGVGLEDVVAAMGPLLRLDQLLGLLHAAGRLQDFMGAVVAAVGRVCDLLDAQSGCGGPGR